MLVLPVFKGVVQYILYGRISGVLMLEGVALGAVLLLSVIKLLGFGIAADSSNLYIKDGVLFRKYAIIPRKNLSSITFTRHFLLDIVGAASVSVNTEAGIYGKKDFEFKLSVNDAARLEAILYGKKPQIELRFPIKRIALLSASASSSLAGLIFVVPVINRAGKLLNIGLSEIFDGITELSKSIKTYFPPAVNIITVIFLIIYGFSFLLALSRNLFFRLSADSEKAEVMSGLFFRKKRIFRKRDVNDICIDRTPLMNLFKTCTVRASIGGYGGEKGERATVVPSMSKRLIKSRFSAAFPILSVKGRFIRPQKNGITKQRFLLLPYIYGVCVTAVLGFLIILFPFFERVFGFVLFVLLAAVCYYGAVSLREFGFSGVSLEKTVIARFVSRFTVRELYVKSEKIGVLKIIRTPADRKLSTCKLRLVVRSESSDAAFVRFVPYGEVKEKINNLYGINI